MEFSCPICVSIFSFVFQFFSFDSGDVFAIPPPFSISQDAFLQYLSLGNITIDLPALYVFGDSFIDPGNNNYLKTVLKSNYTPYGIDFDGKPTGRPTNGRTMVDFIAQIAGLPFPPPVLEVSEASKKNSPTGVNYGSNSGGILPSPRLADQLFGHVLSMDEQIALFENTAKDLKVQFDNAESFAQYMSKSLLFFHIGSNDLGIFWEFERHSNYTVEKYSQFLINELSKQLQKLYELGARKFFVTNVSPLGCQPTSIAIEKPKTPCSEEKNMRVLNYNEHLSHLLSHLQSTLPGSKFVLGDLYKVFEDVFASPASYGFTDIKNSCCIDLFRNQTRPCAPNSEPCKERNKYVYYDPFHPTESMNFLIARRFLKDSSVSSPINLLQLMQA
ncbi:GDSL-motif lipase 7, putative [Theobroma cacao]|uniref:GDSL-motif lipase 7, putative n=1 Tax=Theobroma cacao TaxID=3641 RepID=A0A061EHE7_THECC|nr:GDSL-motif lipase 7, putative [Theobroma cacao]